jgi:hypothetical protein
VLTVVANRDWKPDGGVVVYNFQVEGDHTYFVGDIHAQGEWVWTHNSCLSDDLVRNGYAKPAGEGWQAAHIFPKEGFQWTNGSLDRARTLLNHFDLIDNCKNGFWAKQSGGHAGTHTKEYCDRVARLFESVKTKPQAEAALATLWKEIKVGTYWK